MNRHQKHLVCYMESSFCTVRELARESDSVDSSEPPSRNAGQSLGGKAAFTFSLVNTVKLERLIGSLKYKLQGDESGVE